MHQVVKRPILSAFGRSASATTAAGMCIAALGDISPTLLIVFCGGKLNEMEVLRTFRARFGNIPVVGGAGAGAIATGKFGYSGLEVSVLAFTDQRLTPRVFAVPDLRIGEEVAAGHLAQKMKPFLSDGDTVTLFFDSVATNKPLRLHYASPIVKGFCNGCAPIRPQVLGGGTLTDFNFGDAWVFDGDEIRRHGLVALLWPSVITAETFVLHGCVPASAFLEITKIDGAVVYELDHQPALRVLESRLGLPFTTPDADRSLTLLATLGQKQGDPYAYPYDENAYVNRLILSADAEAGSVTLFEPDFAEGARVQIMSRDSSFMLDSVRRGVRAANEVIAEGDALLALYINCAGRASRLSGARTEETEILTNGLSPSIPLVGFYSGVEIAPFADDSPRALDWTGLLAIMRYRQ
ncbi:FIST signal transduction protein [Inquilinus sp. NPDC058860]|uniref:FIST signal transduction protein n=1 Tax=Inquilinus sp. NPDC058860 TaxID=3346652 RepID=UPI0036CEE7C5